MPSYEFAKEILPNIWLGITPALQDTSFREMHHIIRDIVIKSSFSNHMEVKQTCDSAEVYTFTMNGDETQIER